MSVATCCRCAFGVNVAYYRTGAVTSHGVEQDAVATTDPHEGAEDGGDACCNWTEGDCAGRTGTGAVQSTG